MLNKKILASVSGQTLSLLLCQGIAFLSSALIARSLGPENQGLLSYSLALSSLLIPLANFGVQNALLIELANKKDVDFIVGNALKLRFFGSLSYVAVMSIIGLFFMNSTVKTIFLFLILASFCQISDPIESYFVSAGRWKYLMRANLYKSIIRAILTVVFISYDYSIIAFSSILFFEALVKSFYLINCVGIRNFFGFIRAKVDLSRFVGLIKVSLPMTLSSACGIIILKSDQIIIELYQGPIEVGFYSVATLAIIAFYSIPVIFNSTSMQSLGKNSFESYESDRIKWRIFFDSSFVLGVALLLISFGMSMLIVPIFGADYSKSIAPYLLLTPSILFTSIHASQGSWLKIKGHYNVIVLRSIGSVTVNLLLNFVMVPTLGINGAALATTISQFSILILFPWNDSIIRQNMISPCFCTKLFRLLS